MTDPVKAKTEECQPTVGPGEREFEELTRITNELLTTQRQVQKQRAVLRRLNDEKNLALGIVAHDLRNPLALIELQSDFLLRESAGSLSPAQREMLESIAQQGRLMLSIVNDLLDISAIDAGHFDVKFTHADVNSLVESSVRRNSLLAAEKLVTIRYECPAQNCDAQIDLHKFEQVLNNLIGNAVKYAPTGSEVEVTLAYSDHEFEIRVRDHGPGIPEDELDALFSPFATGAVTTAGGEKSTGLGLAIVHRIVTGHGGSIEVDTKLNQGSCFIVKMGRRADGERSSGDNAAASDERATKGNEASVRDVQRVLIVDDSVGTAKMTGRMLNSLCNAEIKFAHEGNSVVDAVTTFQPDIVFLDIELPEISGIEIARRLRERHGEDTPFLCALTGHREGDIGQMEGRESLDEILTKPVALDQLEDVFKKLRIRQA